MQWSEEGIISSHKFIQKLWGLNSKILEEIKKDHKDNKGDELNIYINKFLKKITENLEKFSYNKIIANMHEMYSFVSKEINNSYSRKNLFENYKKILIAITPIIPHFTSECLEMMEINEIKWIEYDETKIKEDIIKIVIQINGKKRGLIETTKDIDENSVIELIRRDDTIKKYFSNQEIKRKIFVKNKLLNLII